MQDPKSTLAVTEVGAVVAVEPEYVGEIRARSVRFVASRLAGYQEADHDEHRCVLRDVGVNSHLLKAEGGWDGGNADGNAADEGGDDAAPAGGEAETTESEHGNRGLVEQGNEFGTELRLSVEEFQFHRLAGNSTGLWGFGSHVLNPTVHRTAIGRIDSLPYLSNAELTTPILAHFPDIHLLPPSERWDARSLAGTDEVVAHWWQSQADAILEVPRTFPVAELADAPVTVQTGGAQRDKRRTWRRETPLQLIRDVSTRSVHPKA